MAGEVITLTDLGTFGGNNSAARGCSSDASVVVGSAQLPFDTEDFTFHNRAFRWTEAGGMVDLGTLGGKWSGALCCSADGTVIAGETSYAGSGWLGFRWTEAGGMVDMGNMGVANVTPRGMSADGAVLVGLAKIASGAQDHAFRWTQAGGFVDLGAFGSFATDRFSEAHACSADGTVVVGRAYNEPTGFNSVPFRWTEAGGMVSLGSFGGTFGSAYCCSADGNIIFGQSRDVSSTSFAFRWTEAEGLVDLGTIPGGGAPARVYACSADGSIAYGYTDDDLGNQMAARWTQADGWINLGSLGGTLAQVYACSADGLYGAGEARTSGSLPHATLWHVAPPPPFWTGFINCEAT